MKKREVTLRCPFCLTLNNLDMSKAAERPRCGKCRKPILLDRPIRVNEEDFERSVRRAGVPVLVDFYADWCAPCRMVAPLMDQIAGENVGRLLVVKVDTDRAASVAGALGIQSIPTVILFHDGREVRRSVGFDPQTIKSMALELP
jgi:thioredoxin 2